MSPVFPLVAAEHDGSADMPPSVSSFGIFDAKGYWATLGGILYQCPQTRPGAKTEVEHIVRMLNAAYERGKEDMRMAFRETLFGPGDGK